VEADDGRRDEDVEPEDEGSSRPLASANVTCDNQRRMHEPMSDQAQITYTVVLTPGEDGFVLAQVAEVPEAISQGRSVEEAKANVTEALECALAWRRAEGEALPARVEVTVASVTVAA
jgi:predicted RNase H-like HicB family nuclease